MNTGRVPHSQRDFSVLAAGTQVVGDVSTSGDAQVRGRLFGTIRADGQVLVAKGGSVQGEIEAAEVVIGGEVTGHLRASRRADVLASALVHGTINTPLLTVQEGAALDVELRMEPSHPVLHRGAA